jgi:polyisoprenoid-binding protein YceI
MAQVQTEQGVTQVPAGTWEIDPAHSSVGFEVRHMMIATVRGQFREFEGTLETSDELRDCRVHGTVKMASIDTGEPTRDAHLRSADFLDVERYPEARFESTSVEHLGGAVCLVRGELTLKGQTRDIELEATLQGAGEDPWGNERVGVSARGTINRNDFGLTWQAPLPRGGGVLVGEQVTLVIDVSAVRT